MMSSYSKAPRSPPRCAGGCPGRSRGGRQPGRYRRAGRRGRGRWRRRRGRRLFQQLEHAAAADDPVLREGDDLQLDRPVECRGRLTGDVDAVEPYPEVHVEVGAGGGGAVAEKFAQHPLGDGDAGDAQLVAVSAFVGDTPLGGVLPDVGHPRPAPPALVHVGMGVDETGEGEQAGIPGAGSRGDRGDAVPLDGHVDRVTAPGADGAQLHSLPHSLDSGPPVSPLRTSSSSSEICFSSKGSAP